MQTSSRRLHAYETRIVWTGNKGDGTASYRAYSREHEVTALGRPPIPGSSDPAFRGDPTRWNPEQLLVASLSQCHMLWYLHVCSTSAIVVIAYTDNASGSMEEMEDGSGHLVEVVLRPEVTVTDASMVERATQLHTDAHRMCFIASSVNFSVRHEPVVRVTGEPTPDDTLTATGADTRTSPDRG